MLLGAATQPVIVIPHGITAWDWIHAGIIVAATAAICLALRQGMGRVRGGDAEGVVVRLLKRVVTYVVVTVGALYTLGALRVQIGPLLGALGIGGIAVAFAMQDTLQNLVAGVILQARRPFRRGDQVRIDTFEGVVEDVDLRNVSLVTFDGLNVFVPNKTVLENPIVNYTRTPTRRTELSIGVGYGSDLDEAQRVLVKAVEGTPGIEARPPAAAWVHDFGESAINFVVLFWHAVDRASVWQARSDVAKSIKAALDEAGIEMPYPQRSVWLQGDGRDVGSSPGVSRAGAPAEARPSPGIRI